MPLMSGIGKGLPGGTRSATTPAASPGMGPPRFVGSLAAYFRTGEHGKLVRIEAPGHGPVRVAPGQARKVTGAARPGRIGSSVARLGDEIPGRQAHLKVTLFIFQVESGGLVCGHVAVETVPLGQGAEFEARLPLHVNAAVWRRLRIGELVEEAIESVRSISVALTSKLPYDLAEDDPKLADVFGLYRDVATQEYERARPGPKSILTADLLREIVVPAYLSGGRKGLQSVQRALQAVGYPGSGPNFDVTNDQARAAVRKARALKIIPPAVRKDDR